MDARDRLREAGLRATGPRIEVVELLAGAHTPLTHSELHAELAGMDRVTLYRNLLRLVEVGLIREISGRYELADSAHPHFVCEQCGDIECLPAIAVRLDDPRWSEAVAGAAVQLTGACPDCRE